MLQQRSWPFRYGFAVTRVNNLCDKNVDCANPGPIPLPESKKGQVCNRGFRPANRCRQKRVHTQQPRPYEGCRTVQGATGQRTHAHSLEQILQMLAVAPELAAFTEARTGRDTGMLWQNYRGDQRRITQSIFGSHVHEPKNMKSEAPAPGIAPGRSTSPAAGRHWGNPRLV